MCVSCELIDLFATLEECLAGQNPVYIHACLYVRKYSGSLHRIGYLQVSEMHIVYFCTLALSNSTCCYSESLNSSINVVICQVFQTS